ncbi:cleavage stimulation factor subunit 2 CstF64 isoform X2 [Rhodnius prolixus]
MSDKMGDVNIIDKSMRSVFVGNIPYEATEEKLKDIFNEVGPVLSFKLVYDRETGKPKGYGFCEYKDQETALSAMRNLNGYEIGGRSLRVDNACTEKSRLEMQSLLAGPPVDNTYGEAVDSDKAPEAISKAVASLPPEQMFELMKQMKLCIQNNPAEGKAMLLQNPQLAYALLQAQVVMRIVDPQVAITMLHKSNPQVPPLAIPENSTGPTQGVPPPVSGVPPPRQPPPPVVTASMPGPIMAALPPQVRNAQTMQEEWPQPVSATLAPAAPGPPPPGPTPPQPVIAGPAVTVANVRPTQPLPPQFHGQDLDMRSLDPRSATRVTQPPPPPQPQAQDQDLRIPPMVPPPSQPPTMAQMPQFPQEHAVRDPRYQRDPRSASTVTNMGTRAGLAPAAPTHPTPAPRPVAPPAPAAAAGGLGSLPSGASDQEKAALIMQVLQLSDEQIAMLPPEQRKSILVLKEQIAKSTQR